MKIDIEKYWTEPPPEPSPKLRKWLDRIEAGWKPNRRLRQMDPEDRAEFFGVSMWEYLNIIYPKLHGLWLIDGPMTAKK